METNAIVSAIVAAIGSIASTIVVLRRAAAAREASFRRDLMEMNNHLREEIAGLWARIREMEVTERQRIAHITELENELLKLRKHLAEVTVKAGLGPLMLDS